MTIQLRGAIFVASTTTRIYKYHCIVNYWQLLNCTVHMTHEITKQKSTSTFFFLLFFCILYIYILMILYIMHMCSWFTPCTRFFIELAIGTAPSIHLEQTKSNIRWHFLTYMVFISVLFCDIFQKRKIVGGFVDTSLHSWCYL